VKSEKKNAEPGEFSVLKADCSRQKEHRLNSQVESQRQEHCCVCGASQERESPRGRRKFFCSEACRKQASRSRVSCPEIVARYPSSQQPEITHFRTKEFRNSNTLQTRKNDLRKAGLSWIEVNDVTWKLTDGRSWRTPASFGQWAGYDTEWPVAWVIDTGWSARKSLWYVRHGDRSWGPSLSLARAKEAALGLVVGAPLPQDEHAIAFGGQVDLTAIALPLNGVAP